jgi:hypothetical protein
MPDYHPLHGYEPSTYSYVQYTRLTENVRIQIFYHSVRLEKEICVSVNTTYMILVNLNLLYSIRPITPQNKGENF